MTVHEQADAGKGKLGNTDALDLIASASQLVVSKGPKVTRFDLKKGAESKEEIAQAMLGPTGNLRAPTLRVGKTVLVGFNEAAYEEVLI